MANNVFRPLLWPTLLTVAMMPVLLGLGFWQMERLAWKEGLIAAIDERMSAEPVPLPAPESWDGLEAEKVEYLRVRVTGRFLPGREFHYFTQDKDGTPGYAVIAPMALAGSDAVVLVDRGFVPVAFKDPATREAPADEEQTLTGILRLPSPRGVFDGVDDVPGNVWMVRDPAAMAAAGALSGVAPFIVEAEADPSGPRWPKAGRTRLELPNNHLDYALTWFGLALVLSAIYLIYHASRGRFGRPKA